MLSNKTAKIFIIIGVSLIALIFVVWQTVWFSTWTDKSVIADGVKINGYDVSGYDKESAKQMLDIHMQNEIGARAIDIYYDDIDSTLSESAFTELSFDNVLDEALGIARSSNTSSDYLALVKAKFFGISLAGETVFDETALENELSKISEFYFIQAHDAQILSFDPSAGQGHRLSISPQTKGRQLNISKTANSVKEAITSNKNKAQAYLEETAADITDGILLELDAAPIVSEYTINNISPEHEAAIMQVVGAGRYEALLPGQEISIIEFMGGEDYIYFEMPDGGTRSDYERALTVDFPTQIYIASVLSELTATERKVHDIYAKNLPAGASTITNQYYDMKVKNNLLSPIIIRVGFKRQGMSGQIYCEIYRTMMEYKTLLRSVIKQDENKTLVDITRVYVDNKGNAIELVVADTVEFHEN